MSDPKSPDDAAPEKAPDGGRERSFSNPAAAFVVPYESIDDDVSSSAPPASVVVRQSYANEVPPVVAVPTKQPGEDEPTTRVEVIDDAALQAELAGAAATRPAGGDDPPEGPTRRIPVVTDADLEDEEALGPPGSATAADGSPAVIVDGPSEAYAHPNADRCPYCLTFTGLSNARTRGVRYCPMCGADWNSLDREVQAPTGAVIPLGDAVLPPIDDEPEEHPTNEFTRLGPVRPAPDEPGFVAPPEPPPRRGASPWLMLLTGVSLGLAGTMTMAWLFARRQPPAPAVVSAPTPPPPKVSPPVVQTPIAVEPVEKPAVAETPVAPPPKAPEAPPEAPEAPPEAPEAPTPPPEPERPAISEDLVQASLLDARSLLPLTALVEIRPRIDGDIVFLTGLVDSTDTLGHVVSAVAAVEGVRAVDSRGVRPAWKSYTVVRGDSLSKIAQLYYGDTNAWPQIFRANADIVKTPRGLRPGMKLRIPVGSGGR